VPPNGATLEDGVPTIVIRRSPEGDDDERSTAGPEAPAVPEQLIDAPPAAPPSPALQRALEKLRTVFKLRDLRPGQAEIMESVLAGRDTLAIMPTSNKKRWWCHRCSRSSKTSSTS